MNYHPIHERWKVAEARIAELEAFVNEEALECAVTLFQFGSGSWGGCSACVEGYRELLPRLPPSLPRRLRRPPGRLRRERPGFV